MIGVGCVGCDYCDDWFHCDCVNLPPKAGKIRSFTCPRCAKKKSVAYKYGYIPGFHPPEMAPSQSGRGALGLSMPQQTAAVYATLLYENLHDKVTLQNSNVLWHLLHGIQLPPSPLSLAMCCLVCCASSEADHSLLIACV